MLQPELSLLRWSVEYIFGDEAGSPTLIHDLDCSWEALPADNVVRVWVKCGPYAHTLQGMDRYWLAAEQHTYGMFNDNENAAWYEGKQAFAWSWPSADLHTQIADPKSPGHVHVLRGRMLSDTRARELGVLSPHASSPPRPL